MGARELIAQIEERAIIALDGGLARNGIERYRGVLKYPATPGQTRRRSLFQKERELWDAAIPKACDMVPDEGRPCMVARSAGQ